VKRLTTSDPLRVALRQERRLLLVICLLFAALIGMLYANHRLAESVRRLRAEHAADRKVIADLAERYNTALSAGGDSVREILEQVYHDKDKDKAAGR
jgi:hypothetical protein